MNVNDVPKKMKVNDLYRCNTSNIDGTLDSGAYYQITKLAYRETPHGTYTSCEIAKVVCGVLSSKRIKIMGGSLDLQCKKVTV